PDSAVKQPRKKADRGDDPVIKETQQRLQLHHSAFLVRHSIFDFQGFDLAAAMGLHWGKRGAPAMRLV
ncbi:MAG: hypothetical protein ACM335_03190, partial [Deltaproteobacteria bacterium]